MRARQPKLASLSNAALLLLAQGPAGREPSWQCTGFRIGHSHLTGACQCPRDCCQTPALRCADSPAGSSRGPFT
ncbi:hypothetical protein EMIT0P265_160007 [Pseudomonas zeae]